MKQYSFLYLLLFLLFVPFVLFFLITCEKRISCLRNQCDTIAFNGLPQEVRKHINKYIHENPKYRYKGKYEAFDIDRSDSLIVEQELDGPFASNYYINRNYSKYSIDREFAPPFWFYKNYLFWPQEFMLDSISVKYSLYYKVKLD